MTEIIKPNTHLDEPREKHKLKSSMRIGIIGFGPFCRYNYINYLKSNFEKYHIKITFLVELKDKAQSTLEFCKQENITIQEYIFIENEELLSKDLGAETTNRLEKILGKNQIDIVIISTEPKSHFKYLKYFITKNINVLIDKPPVCGFDYETGKILGSRMLGEANEVNAIFQTHTSPKCVVTTQRRRHKGFLKVMTILNTVVTQYNLPINYIGCFHSDGMWNMPDELIDRENHPYRFGYGKIMHSGYHFIDTMFWLQSLNKDIKKYKINAAKFSCSDFAKSINNNNYEQLLGTNRFKNLLEDTNSYIRFGELDSYNIFQFKRDDGTVVSSSSLDLLQNSFSRRAWDKLPKDTYKSNGRLRHESWNIQIAPVLCIQIHSVQSYEERTIAEQVNFNQGDIGSRDHFDINIFRNTALIGGKAFEQIKLGGQERDLMNQARFAIVDQLFAHVYKGHGSRQSLESEFPDHLNTITAISEIYNLYQSDQYVPHDIKYFNQK